jgi:hypothetical protein
MCSIARLVQFVADRLRKLKPSKKKPLFNSIAAMFQFQGGISDGKERMFSELQKRGDIVVGGGRLCSVSTVLRDHRDLRKRARSGLFSSGLLFAHYC